MGEISLFLKRFKSVTLHLAPPRTSVQQNKPSSRAAQCSQEHVLKLANKSLCNKIHNIGTQARYVGEYCLDHTLVFSTKMSDIYIVEQNKYGLFCKYRKKILGGHNSFRLVGSLCNFRGANIISVWSMPPTPNPQGYNAPNAP